MSALAKFLCGKGARVAGSDTVRSAYTEELSAIGVKIATGENKDSIQNYEVIVYTDAIGENDAQLAEAVKCGKEIISRGRLLAEVCKDFKKVIAISGCHGKTTAVSMAAHIFSASNLQFCAHIGGRDKTFSNFYYCGNDYFLTEACEYKKNFLLLKPDIAVVLNSEPDHLECYGSVENLKNAYTRFAYSAEMAVILYGDIGVDGITFGFDKNAAYSAVKISENSGLFRFAVREYDKILGEISLKVYGRHNILNALAAVAVARSAGIDFESIKKGLESFAGVERRFENLGRFKGAQIIADYAHHPEEIAATLKAVNKICKGRLFVVFQPHTYSRTRNFFKEFIKVLSPLKKLLVYRTFAAREYFDDAGSALTLSQRLKNSQYGETAADIVDFINGAGSGDCVLILGAGDIYDIAKDVLSGIGQN